MFEQDGSPVGACFEVFVLSSNPASNHCARSLFGDERRQAAAQGFAVWFDGTVVVATAEVARSPGQRVVQNGQCTLFDPVPALSKVFKRLFAQVNSGCRAIAHSGTEYFVHQVAHCKSRIVSLFVREHYTRDFFVEVFARAGQIGADLRIRKMVVLLHQDAFGLFCFGLVGLWERRSDNQLCCWGNIFSELHHAMLVIIQEFCTNNRQKR